MENLKWLWDYLHDLYKPPTTYICPRDRFNWMCYTSSAVEQLENFVKRNAKKVGVEEALKTFYVRGTLFKDLEMAMAYNNVAKAAWETYKLAH